MYRNVGGYWHFLKVKLVSSVDQASNVENHSPSFRFNKSHHWKRSEGKTIPALLRSSFAEPARSLAHILVVITLSSSPYLPSNVGDNF